MLDPKNRNNRYNLYNFEARIYFDHKSKKQTIGVCENIKAIMKSDLLIIYKNYLLTGNKAGKATIKNYLADIRKFVAWYEGQFNKDFEPSLITKEIANLYLTGSTFGQSSSTYIPSASSLKRYGSSLRKYYEYLIEEKTIQTNPFELNKSEYSHNSDPWHIKEFQNYLFLSKISSITLKNYIIDIKQFTQWAQEAVIGSEMPAEGSVLQKMDSSIIDEYKTRLLHEAKLSPVSINRKLSSLRKYFGWAQEQQLRQSPLSINSQEEIAEPQFNKTTIESQPALSLYNLHDLEESAERKSTHYSQFGPMRFLQKTTKGINSGLNLLILKPIDKTAEIAHYTYWKLSGRKVFGTIEEIMGTAAPIVANEAANQLQAANPINQSLQTAKIIRFVSNKLGIKPTSHLRIQNFPKSFYAPLKLSTRNLPLTKRMWYHVRHTRPAWYHKYHSYQIVTYLHYGILLMATSMIGFHVYSTLALESRAQVQLTASPAMAPPRTLSFQGKLKDKNNLPITAETSLRFAIYKSPTATGSAQLWEETQRVTPSDDGTFTVTLGRQSLLHQNIFTDYPSLFLGISVGNDDELKPREALPNVTTAGNANLLQGLKPITQSNAGTRNVILALDSSGNLTIGGSANPVFQASGGELTLSGQVLTLTTNSGSNSNIQLKPDGTGIIDLQGPIQNTSQYNNIPSALGAVEIDDLFAILATSSGQSALTINQNGTGPIISASAGGIAKFTVDSQGNTFAGGTISLNGNKLSSSANDFTLLSTPINISFGTNASSVSIGTTYGTTSINHSLKVGGISTFASAMNALGLITANEGLTVAQGKNITLNGFQSGSIPFIDGNNRLASDTANLYWDVAKKRLGIGTNNPGSKLTINNLETGTGTALVIDSSGNIFRNSSSRQYKDDIKPLNTNALVLLNAAPVSFRYKDTGSYDIGYIAEDFDALGLKDLVVYDKSGKPDAIRYDKLSIYILEIIKGQQSTIRSLEETLVTIKAGYDEVQHIASNNLINITENITIGGEKIKDYIDEKISGSLSNNTNISQTDSMTKITSPVASTSGIQSPAVNANLTKSASNAASFESSSTSAQLLLSNSIYLSTNISSESADASSSALPSVNLDANTFASSSGTFEVKSPLFQPGNVVNIKYQAEKTDYANIASYAADLAFVPNFKSDYATFNQGLIALGPTSLTDVGISGKLSLGGNLSIDSNSINTVGSDLNLQPLRQGNLSIMGGLVVITTDGDLNVNGNASFAKDATVKGKLAAGIIAPVPQEDLLISLPSKNEREGSSLVVKNATGSAVLAINQSGDVISSGEGKFNTIASKTFKIIRGVQADTSLTETVADGAAGTGTITAYERERTIRTPYVNKNSLIYVTATSNTQQVAPYVARQSENSFTVQIPENVTKDITFNWWVVN